MVIVIRRKCRGKRASDAFGVGAVILHLPPKPCISCTAGRYRTRQKSNGGAGPPHECFASTSCFVTHVRPYLAGLDRTAKGVLDLNPPG